MSFLEMDPAFDGRARNENLFFALYPPLDVAQAIALYFGRMFETGLLNGRRVAPERLHISLNSLGRFSIQPEPLIGAVREALSKLDVTSFRISLNRIMGFRNPGKYQPLVLSGDDGIIGIDQLYDGIYELLFRARVIRGAKPSFRPHLTVSRESFLWREDFIDPLIWDVTEFRLIHSEIGRSRHNVLASWPLAPRIGQ